MLTAALAPHPHLIPDNTEIKRDTYSWTIDTVRELVKNNPQEKLYFLSGSEGFLKITTWKEYRALLKMINFIVVMRTGDQEEKVSALLKREIVETIKNLTGKVCLLKHEISDFVSFCLCGDNVTQGGMT